MRNVSADVGARHQRGKLCVNLIIDEILALDMVLEMKMFTKATKDDPAQGLAEVDIPSEDSKVFALPLWNFRCISVVDLREIEKWR